MREKSDSTPPQKRESKWRNELRELGLRRATRDLEGWDHHGYKPWHTFRLAMQAYISDLRPYFPDIQDDLNSLFKRLRTEGKKIRAWDICGAATGEDIGVDETDCLTRVWKGGDAETRREIPLDSKTVFEGDIFTKEALDPMIDRARERGAPALITMIPVGGFSTLGQRDHPFGTRMLGYQLHRALEILAPGGHLYFQNPYHEGTVKRGEKDFDRLKRMVRAHGEIYPVESGSRYYRIIKFDQVT